MVSNSHPYKNAQKAKAGSNQPEDSLRPAEKAPTPNFLGTLFPAPASARYTEENLERITKLYMNSFLKVQGHRHKNL